MITTIDWSSVDARLPDDEETVLVHIPGTSEPVWLGYHMWGRWYTVEGFVQPVTHWAELPEGPRG